MTVLSCSAVYRYGKCIDSSDPDKWFREEPRGPGSLELARRYAEEACEECPVRHECLELALSEEREYGASWGIWGGTCARDRRAVRQRLARLDSADRPDVEYVAKVLLRHLEQSEDARSRDKEPWLPAPREESIGDC